MKKSNFTNKKRSMATGLCLALVCYFAISCEELISTEDQAQKASEEFCECVKTKSKDDCLKELEKNYSNAATKSFVDAFNKVNACGYELELTTTYY